MRILLIIMSKLNREGGNKMYKYKCVACGYIYDDAVEPVKFADLPEDWVCPLCGVPKSSFVKVEE